MNSVNGHGHPQPVDFSRRADGFLHVSFDVLTAMTSETSVNLCQSIQRYNPEDSRLQYTPSTTTAVDFLRYLPCCTVSFTPCTAEHWRYGRPSGRCLTTNSASITLSSWYLQYPFDVSRSTWPDVSSSDRRRALKSPSSIYCPLHYSLSQTCLFVPTLYIIKCTYFWFI
jgi:hypothetical protein